MLSTIVRALFPSASDDLPRTGFPNFGGRWTPVVGGTHGTYLTSSGEPVSEPAAYAVSAWFACIRNIAEDIAKLPLGVYERDDDDREQLYDHQVARALRRPNPLMSAFSFRETMIQHALGFGDGFAEIARTPTGGMEFYPLDPTRVVILNDQSGLRYRYADPDTNTSYTFRSEDVLHIHGLGFDGIRGYSLALVFRELLGTVLANLKVTGAMWSNGLFVGGVLQHPGALGDDALRNLRQSFENRHGGSKNAGKLMILEEGMTFTQLAIDPEKAQLIEQRQFDVEEVARVYRMPLHKIGHLLRSTFNNIEHQAREYVIDCLMPWIVRCEQEYDRKLLVDDDSIYTKHNVMGLLRGDEAARSDYYMKMVQLGMTQNRILALEEMPGIGPEGDIPYIAQNIRPATEDARKAQVKSLESAPRGTQEPVKNNPSNMPEDKGGRPKNSIASAYVEALETMIDPLARKEANAIGKAAQKFFDDRSKFLNTVARFHVEHAEHLRQSMEPAVGALVAILGGERNDPRIDAQVRAFIHMDIESKVSQIQVCDFPSGVDRLVEIWITRGVNTTANDLAGIALGLVERIAA